MGRRVAVRGCQQLGGDLGKAGDGSRGDGGASWQQDGTECANTASQPAEHDAAGGRRAAACGLMSSKARWSGFSPQPAPLLPKGRRPTFLQPSVGCCCPSCKDGFDVNPNGAVNAVLASDDAEAQALGEGDRSD